MEMRDVYLDGNAPRARARRLTVADDASEWHQFHGQMDLALADLDVVLMRKDPPFDMEYIYMTYMLEHAAAAGALVVNHPTGLRDANEKAFIAHFPQCIAPTLISREAGRLHEFTERHGRVALKPLDSMGGASVFIVNSDDANRNVIVETLTGKGATVHYGPAIPGGHQAWRQAHSADRRQAGGAGPGARAESGGCARQFGRRGHRQRCGVVGAGPVDLRAGGAHIAGAGAAFRGPGCHRRLPDGDQCHKPHLR